MKLLLFSRRGVVHAADELRRTFAAIACYGFDFVVNKEFAETIRSLGVAQIPAEKEYGCNACPPVGDGAVMVCYGGDGTLLDGVRLLGGAPVPVVGINAGHMGFLTGGRKEAIEELFAEIARGTLRIEQRTMLRVEGAVEGMPQGALAVNEAAVQRSGAGMISVECRVDDQQVATYYGDGVIVSTPTGSTAYSLSAGGPVVAPTCACLVISPLAPHNLTMRPVVIPDSATITLRIDARRSDAFVTLDSRVYAIGQEAAFTIKRAEQKIFLAVPHNISFYDTLRNKMMWGIDIRS